MLTFLGLFDDPLSKYLFLKEFLACDGCFRLNSKIKKDLGQASDVYFLHDFPI